MIIKVCGLRDTNNINEVAALDIDMIGFNFWPKSKRFVSMLRGNAGTMADYSSERLSEAASKSGYEEDYEQVTKIVIPRRVKRVGLFVDEMPQTVVAYTYNYKLDYIQLHGYELPVEIENLKRTLIPDIAPDVQIIKAFGISTEQDLEQCAAYEGIADMFIFDYKSAGKGGSGKHFDWTVLEAYRGKTPFLLSGGIGPDDAEAIKSFHHPAFAGIDVNSRFETAPAVKDVEMLRKFVEKIRN